METVHLTCIGCPLGCALTVQTEGGEVKSVEGYTCNNGKKYAYKEMTNPTRIVTTTVRVRGGQLAAVSVRTASDVPKARMLDCVRALKDLEVEAPIAMGQVLLRDVAGTGVDVIATRNIHKV